jgi:hypothetical protein
VIKQHDLRLGSSKRGRTPTWVARVHA